MELAAVRTRLLELYHALAEHYAHEPHWWPIITADPPFEVLVGMVLVQQTRWQAVEGAIRRLIEHGLMSPTGLAKADTDELALLIRPCAFHSQKALGLQQLALHIVAAYNCSTAALLAQPATQLRSELLGLPRVGRETADTVMLYAGGHPMFIVDAYARRILGRAGLPSRLDLLKAPYDSVRDLVERAIASGPLPVLAPGRSELPTWVPVQSPLTAFYWDFHAVLVEASIHHCLATRMRCSQPGLRPSFVDQRKCQQHCSVCSGCPLASTCATVVPGRTLEQQP